MSDDGSVMIGTNGEPLLSADGKIVLADDLYPRVPAFTISYFNRQHYKSWGGCINTEIWAKDWSSGFRSPHAFVYKGDWDGGSFNSRCGHSIHQRLFTVNDQIDWTRVVAIRHHLNISGGGSFREGPFTCRWSQNTGSVMPGGTGVLSWTDAGTGKVVVDQMCNGVKPDSFEYAMFFPSQICDWPFGYPGDSAGSVTYDSTMQNPMYVIYNVA